MPVTIPNVVAKPFGRRRGTIKYQDAVGPPSWEDGGMADP